MCVHRGFEVYELLVTNHLQVAVTGAEIVVGSIDVGHGEGLGM